jgi:hypothetical protein
MTTPSAMPTLIQIYATGVSRSGKSIVLDAVHSFLSWCEIDPPPVDHAVHALDVILPPNAEAKLCARLALLAELGTLRPKQVARPIESVAAPDPEAT